MKTLEFAAYYRRKWMSYAHFDSAYIDKACGDQGLKLLTEMDNCIKYVLYTEILCPQKIKEELGWSY